jgi:hypothetical protein
MNVPTLILTPQTPPTDVILQPSLPSALPKELFHPHEIEATKPEGIGLDEWKCRLELAALYRVFHARGWDEVGWLWVARTG